MKKLKILCFILLCSLMLAGCGKEDNEELTEYQENMNTFFEHIAEYNDSINNIDVNEEGYVEQLLELLDGLDAEVAWMSTLEVPEQFAAVDSLADEASENMTQAVLLYHMVYEDEEYNQNVEDAAREYYGRANIRIKYIVMLLHGEIPEGEGVIYTEENKIFDGGYMNESEEDGSDTNE